MPHVFAGIKVAEFGAFAAGPGVGKVMANHGAEVVHVESSSRPDGFRTHYPPYTENKPGINRSGTFAIHNDNKYDLTLDLKAPGALDVARRLIAWADVVIENFTPGTMERLGLGYEDLCAVRPDIIMLRSCNQGQSGPHASHPGFGSQLTALSGFVYLTGYPDDYPVILYGPYIDYIGVGYGLAAVAAALDYRRRTGKGQCIDLAQYEGGLQFMAPVLLDFLANGRVWSRQGNRCEYAAPHGVYPCRGEDRWCTISVFCDAEWQALVEAMGRPLWALDEKFATFLGRKAHEDELDRELSAWTAQFPAEQVMERLQAAGVHAAVVNTMADLYTDPQLKHRRMWRTLEHPEMGRFSYEGPPFILSKTPAEIHSPAPLIGEDNEYVLTEKLGYAREEVADLVARGIIR